MTGSSNATKRAEQAESVYEGGCTCGAVRYRLSSRPLIVHGCHCTLCQKQTGGAYAVNALIEQDRLNLLSGALSVTRVSTPSGAGQSISRCKTCGVAVWSKYHALLKIGDQVLFVRVGTLDDPAAMPPDVHIHTASKQPHVNLAAHTPRFEEFYDAKNIWSPESLGRFSDALRS